MITVFPMECVAIKPFIIGVLIKDFQLNIKLIFYLLGKPCVPLLKIFVKKYFHQTTPPFADKQMLLPRS